LELLLDRFRRPPRALRLAMLAAVAAAAVLAVFFRPPIFQDRTYFGHADQRTLLGLPNALNVLSNLPFACAAWFGLRRVRMLGGPQRTAARIAFLAVGAVTIGSGFYHLDPRSTGLLVDRLPISLAFAALFAWILGDRLGASWTSWTLVPLLALSLLTLWIWYGGGELDGDLRPYGLVQAIPLACLPFLLVLFPGELDERRLALALLFYLAAKGCELLDGEIYALGRIVSGHTLKHLLAAAACVYLAPAGPVRTAPAGLR
jgi:hypothetical protein